MKIYKVKVNGKVYEVELEAVSESAETIKTEAAPAQAAAPSCRFRRKRSSKSSYRGQSSFDKSQGRRRS